VTDNEAIRELARAVRAIAHGDSMPTGLEALCMALIGEGSNCDHNVVSSLDAIGRAIDAHADATDKAADALFAVAHVLGLAALGDHERLTDVVRQISNTIDS
jgi:hypothetical protein